ncbi:MAG: response regulator [Myxococcaceae bacterium]|nr:response regulator [Myxococcaceae bacterium]
MSRTIDFSPLATPAETQKKDVPASVLIVDDRMANLIALEAVLAPLRVDVVKATSGEEALWKLLDREFALVLLDVQMPGMDGFRVASLVRERPSTRALPIIFLTALSREPENIFKGYEHGAVDYLVKPFDANVLRSKVSVFVELYRKTKLVEQQGELLRLQERAELELESERRFRRVIEAVPVCIWAMRTSGDCYYANKKAWSCFPAGATQLTGFLDALHPEDRPNAESMWNAARPTFEAFELECRLRNRADTWRWHSLGGVPKYDDAGLVAGWIVSAADIDRSRRAEESLLLKEHELQVANKVKDAFLAAASHELRSPLAAAKAQVGLALRKLNKNTAEFPGKAFAVIDRQIDRMTRQVDDMLDATRIQHQRLALEPKTFDVAELVREVHERVDGSSDRHVFKCVVSDGLVLNADRDRLDQVLTNLLTNAVRYSPEGGEILLGAEPTVGSVHLYVKDHGIGIPKEKQQKIFERFGQAHGASYGGLGLGLTIVEGIVQQHGGKVWVESEPGRGSTFHVQLPSPEKTEEAGQKAV